MGFLGSIYGLGFRFWGVGVETSSSYECEAKHRPKVWLLRKLRQGFMALQVIPGHHQNPCK